MSTGPGATSLYVTGLDGRVWSKFFPDPARPGNWSPWFPLDKNIFSKPGGAGAGRALAAAQPASQPQSTQLPAGLVSAVNATLAPTDRLSSQPQPVRALQGGNAQSYRHDDRE